VIWAARIAVSASASVVGTASALQHMAASYHYVTACACLLMVSGQAADFACCATAAQKVVDAIVDVLYGPLRAD
jgi:hypothetical protein